jgi:Skp family chaperone for outer membrane proteins
MNKKSFVFLIILFTSFSGVNLFAQDKIAFIDLNFVYSNSNIGKKIIKEIETKRKNINKDFKEFQSKLDNEKKKLISQKNVLAEDEYKKKVIDLENNLKKYNEIISKKNKDLIDYQNKSKNEFVNKLRSTLEKYAKEKSISMILRKEQVLIGVNKLDVSKDILELVNKG